MQSERQLNERPNYNRIIFLGFNQQMRLRRETSLRYIRRAQNAHTYQHHTHLRTLNSNEGQTKLMFHMNIVSVPHFEIPYQNLHSRQRTENQQIHFVKTMRFD